MFVMCVPAAAFAATASFSAVAPAKGSTSTVSRPAITVTVSDAYGVKGSGSYSMLVDGLKVKPSIVYTMSRYRKFRLTYRPTSDLRVGAHVVKVTVKDLKKKSSSYSWTFTVVAPAPPAAVDMPSTIAADDCATCHAGYPALHPMAACSSCHGPDAPLGEPEYVPASGSAHTLGCSLETPCHGGGGAFPHVLGRDCASCHNGAYLNVPAFHGTYSAEDHTSTGSFCTQQGCHLDSLTREHNRTAAGVRLTCLTCHGSDDPKVQQAISDRETACTACHAFVEAAHPGAAAHVRPANDCTIGGCHDASDVVATHKGACVDCHGTDKTASTTCTNCHKGHDHTATPANERIVIAGVDYGTHQCSECHTPLDLVPIHGGGSASCAACHPVARAALGAWTGGCVQGGCHTPGSKAPRHASIAGSHALTTVPGCTAADCHAGGSSVAAIHRTQGCATCHAAGRTPTLACATVGCHGPKDSHPASAPHPAMTAGHSTGLPGTCAKAGCHKADLPALHAAALGCATCHGTGKVSKKVCTTSGCHAAVTDAEHHANFAAHHALDATPSCVGTDCHAGGRDVKAIHATLGCETCHADGRPGLTLTCATVGCHSASDPHPVTGAHPKMTAGHSQGLSTTCVVAGCHSGDVATLHASARGCASCHGVGKVPTKDCATAGCHPYAVSSTTMHKAYATGHTAKATGCTAIGCHPVSVVTIHTAGTTPPGCPACHADGKPALTLECATAGCHPVTPRSHAGHPVTPASEDVVIGGTSYGTHACSECHAPLDLIELHGSTCAACHPGAANAATFDGGCVQGTCHVTGALAKHGSIVSGHTLATTPSCAGKDCHMGGPNAAAIHRMQGCATCHSTGKTPTLVCATAGCHSDADVHPASDPHPLMTAGHTTGLPITCVLAGCHNGDLVALHADADSCGTCHGGGAVPTKQCATPGCHPAAVSSTSLHPSYGTGHTTDATGCTVAGCHSASVIAIHTNGRTAPGCPACHAADKPALTLVCATTGCHPVTSASHDGHPVIPAREVFTIGGTDFGSHSCSECHATLDLMDLHGRTCAACHPGAADTATFSGGCVQPACHMSGTLAKHGTIESAHTLSAAPTCIGADCHTGGTNLAAIHRTQGCATCHGPGVTATVVCATAGCHSDADGHPLSAPHPKMAPGHTTGITASCVRAGCHAVDLVALHAAKQGCETCHGAGTTPSKVCSQSGCHPTIRSTTQHPGYVTAHTLQAASSCIAPDCHVGGADVTAIHTTQHCTECHSTGRPPLTLTCATAGCHGGSDAHPAADPHPDMVSSHTTGLPADCVKSGCHSSDLVALHASKQRCATCHGAGKTPTKTCVSTGCHPEGGSPAHLSHPSGETTIAMKINNLGMGVHACTECHSSMDLQVVHGENGTQNSCPTCHPTAAGTVTTGFTKCATSDCHAGLSHNRMHSSIDAVHTLPTQPTCTSVYTCHVGNKDVALTHYLQGCKTCHAPGVTPTIDCLQCHEQARTGDHQDAHAECNDCHQPYVWDPATSTANKGADLAEGLHWPLFDAQWTVLIGRAVIRPGYPYGDYTQLVFPGPIGTPGPYVSSPYFDRTGTYTCTTCHTGAGKTWVHPGSGYFTCGSTGDCHGHHANWDPAQGAEDYVHNTPPASWRQTMKW